MEEFDTTTPAGRPSLSVDFARLLPTAVTLSSVAMSISVHPLSAAADPTPSSRLDGAAAISGTTVSQWFLGGVPNVDYVLTYLATFSNGEKQPVQARIPIRTLI